MAQYLTKKHLVEYAQGLPKDLIIELAKTVLGAGWLVETLEKLNTPIENAKLAKEGLDALIDSIKNAEVELLVRQGADNKKARCQVNLDLTNYSVNHVKGPTFSRPQVP